MILLDGETPPLWLPDRARAEERGEHPSMFVLRILITLDGFKDITRQGGTLLNSHCYKWNSNNSRFNRGFSKKNTPWVSVESRLGSTASEVVNLEGTGRLRSSGRRLSLLADGWGGSDRPASAGLKTTTASSSTGTHWLQADCARTCLQNKTNYYIRHGCMENVYFTYGGNNLMNYTGRHQAFFCIQQSVGDTVFTCKSTVMKVVRLWNGHGCVFWLGLYACIWDKTALLCGEFDHFSKLTQHEWMDTLGEVSVYKITQDITCNLVGYLSRFHWIQNDNN